MLSTLADVDGNLTADNTVLSCETNWILDKKIYVTSGKSLTINPGTAIKGNNVADAAALIVSSGAKIFAPGTRECPIVFTAAADPLDGSYGIENKGQWGGVVLLGKAKNNLIGANGGFAVADGIGFIEGFTSTDPRIQYGAAPGSEDDDDNSGIMTYVSIRHAGDEVGAANELNGLSLGSVGRGTTLSHIEVVSNLDDGVEFFGGTVDLKYASVLFSGDDNFDWDQGWSGRGQFWVAVKTDQVTASGDNGFELDGDDSNSGLFYSSPKIYNATIIGGNDINNEVTADGNVAIELKEGSFGEIYSSVFANFGKGVQLYEDGEAHDGTGDTYDHWTAGTLLIENNTFIGVDDLLNGNGVSITPADTTTFLGDGNTDLVSLAGFSPIHVMNPTTNAVTTEHDIIPGANIATTSTPPVDGFYTPTDYRGAFRTGDKSWLSDYSYRALINLERALVPCVTDLNNDGITDVNDFLSLLGQFNVACN